MEDLINVFWYLMAGGKDRVRLFLVACNKKTRCDSHKLKYNKFHLNIRKNVLTVRVVTYCNTLPQKLWSGHEGRYSKPIQIRP